MVRRAESRAYDLESAIPREFRDEILVSPEEFLQELDFLQKSAPETKKPYVRFGGGDLLMSVGGSEFRTAIRTEGESTVTFGFDLRFMKDALRQFRGEERVISATDSKVKVLLIPTNEELMIAMDTASLVG